MKYLICFSFVMEDFRHFASYINGPWKHRTFSPTNYEIFVGNKMKNYRWIKKMSIIKVIKDY